MLKKTVEQFISRKHEAFLTKNSFHRNSTELRNIVNILKWSNTGTVALPRFYVIFYHLYQFCISKKIVKNYNSIHYWILPQRETFF